MVLCSRCRRSRSISSVPIDSSCGSVKCDSCSRSCFRYYIVNPVSFTRYLEDDGPDDNQGRFTTRPVAP